MTEQQTQAMLIALEALKNAYWPTKPDLIPAHNIKECEKAITALRAALADQALDKMAKNAREIGLDYEPVSAECKFDREEKWVRCEIAHHNLVQSEPHNWPGYQTRLLYTHPQAREPLTDEQCDDLLLTLDEWARGVDHYEYGLPLHNEELRGEARNIIRAAHGIGEKK